MASSGSKPARLHLLYKREGQPSTRLRLVQMAPYLEREGLACRVAAYPRSRAERHALRAALAPGDRVLVHRKLPGVVDGRFLRRLPVPLLFDFDDAVMVRKLPLLGSHRSGSRHRRFRRMLAACDGVICGNSFLASTCHGSGLPVLIAPTAVPVGVPQRADQPPSSIPRIGWVGLHSNTRFLQQIAAALRRLAAQREFELTVISEQPFELAGVCVRWEPWRIETQEAAIARFDLGIMPLELDSDWSRGKCAYKLLQYMAAGVPAVGSDVGMNAELIEHGRNGLLARSLDDWVEGLRRLLDDPALRRRLGRAGRATAEAGFSYTRIAPRIAHFVRALGKRGQAWTRPAARRAAQRPPGSASAREPAARDAPGARPRAAGRSFSSRSR